MLAGQGHCAADNKCENGAFGTVFTPAPGVNIPINGWNLLNLANFFATRDNFRQQVISHAQLARILAFTDTGNLGQQAGGITIDPAKLNYAGQSLGGILGSLYAAASPAVKNAALNVPGGDPELILLTSPAFAAQKAGFQAGLAAQGVPTDSPLYDTFLIIAKWIIDPADPVNAGAYLTRDTGSAGGILPNGGNQSSSVRPVDPERPGGAESFHAGTHPLGGRRPRRDGCASASHRPGRYGELLVQAVRQPRESRQQPWLPPQHGRWHHTAQGEIAGFVAGAPPFP